MRSRKSIPVAFRSIFNAREGVSTSLASYETALHGQSATIDLVLSPCERASHRPFTIASQFLIVGDCGRIGNRKGRVLINADTIQTSTGLRIVSSASEITIGFIGLNVVDGGATEALKRLATQEDP